MNFLSSNPISTERATRIKQQREAKANSHPSLEAEGAHSTKHEGRGRRERDYEDCKSLSLARRLSPSWPLLLSPSLAPSPLPAIQAVDRPLLSLLSQSAIRILTSDPLLILYRTFTANLSPWQGIDSPTSSDFEQLQRPDSDVEIVFHDIVPQQQRRPLSDYARSISSRGRDRSLSVEEELELGRGVEGDDEDSSAFEDAGDDGRGRGRTRERRRDPELKRSLLEDALRSS